jgi:hypothetical protein
MGVQSDKSPNFENFETPNLGIPEKMTFGCSLHGKLHRIIQGGRWWLPPSLDRGEFCESMYANGSSMHQKCSNYALTSLLLVCIDWYFNNWSPLVTHPSPHPKALARPLTLEMLQTKEHTSILFSSIIFKEFGGVSISKTFTTIHYFLFQ